MLTRWFWETYKVCGRRTWRGKRSVRRLTWDIHTDTRGSVGKSTQIKELARGVPHRWVYKDQDLLNVHFRGEWHEVPLIWNAQGLGTYADGHSTDRAQIAAQIEEMKAKPTLVHFTGPTNPDVEIVLNPWVQPYTSKPWGYAGAPGHPFSEVWWEALREVSGWEGYRTSGAFGAYKTKEKDMALERAQKKLEDALKSLNGYEL